MNNIEKILQYIDELMLQETESNLTPVQEAILTGVYQGQKYLQIAESYNGCSESHIKQEASKLWKKLTPVLGEEINSDNFRQKVEKKYRVSQGDNSIQFDEVNGDIKICGKTAQNPDNTQQKLQHFKTENQFPIIDLEKAPEELNYNYGRNTEMNTLKQWILENKTKLITIYGLSGIGKTALTLKLIPEIEENFDYIIYRSLDKIPKLINLKDDLKTFFDQTQTKPLTEIIDYFKSYHCLAILDDVHNIFKTGDLAGQYLPEYRDYGKFFQEIATLSHQSCLILISWENFPTIENLETENQYIKTLQLQGLGEDATEILRQKSLQDEDQWNQLITLYQGHPRSLNIIALTIEKYYYGSVSRFLNSQDQLFLGDIEGILAEYLERLSELEIKVINWLANQDQDINIEQLPNELEISKIKSRYLQIIQSLKRRNLLEIVSQEEVKIKLNSVLKIYILNQDIE